MVEFRPVSLLTPDGVRLGGQLTAGPDAWVIVQHDLAEDLDVWRPLQDRLQGFTVLAMDLRGHGLSGGTFGTGAAEEDMVAAIRWARGRGAVRLGIVAAGSTAPTALGAALREPIDAVVLISPPAAKEAELRPRVPKLILVGGADLAALEASRSHYQYSIGPATIVDFPVAEQGSGLLHTAFAVHVAEQIAGFLSNTLSLGHMEANPSG